MRLARDTGSHQRLVTMYGRRRDDDESGAGIDHCRAYPATISSRERHPGSCWRGRNLFSSSILDVFGRVESSTKSLHYTPSKISFDVFSSRFDVILDCGHSYHAPLGKIDDAHVAISTVLWFSVLNCPEAFSLNLLMFSFLYSSLAF